MKNHHTESSIHKVQRRNMPVKTEVMTVEKNQRSVNRYIDLEKCGELAPKIGAKGRSSKIDDRGYEIIKLIIEKDPTITLEELSRVFYKKKKVKVGRSILSRACQELELNRKKLSRYASERD